MFTTTTFTAQETIFASMPATLVADAAKPAPTEGPYDWSSDVYGGDCFVFTAEITQSDARADA